MTLEDYKNRFGEDDAPGWDAIDGKLAEIYPGREPDFHFGTLIKYRLGGPDPIDGAGIYKRTDPTPHLHFVSYGMSELYYNEEAAGNEFSKWGFEFTFRLAVHPDRMPASDGEAPVWPINLMQNLARYVFESEKWFEHGHYLNANGPIMADAETDIVAILFSRDPELGTIATPHGALDFLQIVGITLGEVESLFGKQQSTAELLEKLSADNPLLITDLARRANDI